MSRRNDSHHSLHLKPADQVKVTLLIEPVSKQLAAIQAKCKTIVQQNRSFCDEKRRILDKVKRLKEKSERVDVLELSLRETEQQRIKLLDRNTNLEEKLDLSNRGLQSLQQELASKDKLIALLQQELSKEKQRNQNLSERVDQLTSQLGALSSSESPAKHSRDSRYLQRERYKHTDSEPVERLPCYNRALGNHHTNPHVQRKNSSYQGGRHTRSFQRADSRRTNAASQTRGDHRLHDPNVPMTNDEPSPSKVNGYVENRNGVMRKFGHLMEETNDVEDRSEAVPRNKANRYKADRNGVMRIDDRHGSASRSELMFRHVTSTPRRTLNPQFDDIVEDLFFQ